MMSPGYKVGDIVRYVINHKANSLFADLMGKILKIRTNDCKPIFCFECPKEYVDLGFGLESYIADGRHVWWVLEREVVGLNDSIEEDRGGLQYL